MVRTKGFLLGEDSGIRRRGLTLVDLFDFISGSFRPFAFGGVSYIFIEILFWANSYIFSIMKIFLFNLI